jgi:flagellar hook assembly protein FlgD
MKRLLIILICSIVIFMSCDSNVLNPVETGSVGISFKIPEEGNGILEIENRYDTIVKSIDLGILSPGTYLQGWDFTDNDGNYVNEGIYFIYIYLDDEPIYSGRQILVFNYE